MVKMGKIVRTLLYVLTFWLMLRLLAKLAYEINFRNIVDDPDIYRNVSELISSKRYPVEDHSVLTTDGYQLSVQRIAHGKVNNVDGHDKEAILLIHGIMTDASIWVLNFPDQSLGFILADKGYDVWLLNTRGCRYSKKHIKYTPNQYQFWNFSFDQVAQYDVPATIDYILKSARKEHLYVAGHSQGTSVVFAMLSEMPDYNDKVKLFIALAPVAFLHQFNSTIANVVIPFTSTIEFVSNLMNYGELLLTDDFLKLMLTTASGMNVAQVNQTRLGVYNAHSPSSTSVRSLVHFLQLVTAKKFRKYDYGYRRNLEIYNQEEPPDYDLSRITAQVALIWSMDDKFVHFQDIEHLRRSLNSLVYDYCIPHTCGHVDYVLSVNAPKITYEPLLSLLSKY